MVSGESVVLDTSCSVEDLFLQEILLQHFLETNEEVDSVEEDPTLEKRAKIKKDDDLSSAIDDDENVEKRKDAFEDTFKDISVKMLGFDRFHLEQYERQLLQYERFLKEFLDGDTYSAIKGATGYSGYGVKGEQEKKERWDTMSWKEIKEYSRKANANAIIGVATNHTDPEMSERYKLWQVFMWNRNMAFLYYDMGWNL